MKGDSVKSKKGVDLRAQAEQFAAQRAAVLADPAKPARDRAESIRDGLRSWVATRLLITEAYKGQDWIALGYTSWELYCDREFDMKSLRLTAEERNAAILSFRSVGMTTREIGAATGTSKDTVSRALKPKVDLPVSDETKLPLVDALRGEIEAAAERTETSAAGPAANPEGDSPVLGEPVDVGVAAASTGTQTAADGADTTEADAGPARPVAPTEAATAPESVGDQEQERDEEEVACFECSAPLDPRDAADGYYKCLDCDPERLFRAAPDSPAADPLAPPSPQQPGQDSPTGREGGRSETIHQQVAGVSPAGVAPGSGSGPQHADPVEPVELEDGGDASLPPSSSDPVLMAFAALLILIRQVDVEALGPRLFDEEMALLDQHVDDIALFVAKLGKARFAEMLHTQ